MAERTKALIFLHEISMLLQVMNATRLKRESRDTVVDLNGQRVLRPCESLSDFSHSRVVLLLEREMCDFKLSHLLLVSRVCVYVRAEGRRQGGGCGVGLPCGLRDDRHLTSVMGSALFHQPLTFRNEVPSAISWRGPTAKSTFSL